MRRRPREEGFTLIELVVALAMLSLMALLTAEILRLATHAWQASRRAITDADEVETAQAVLREKLEHLLPAQTASPGDAPTAAFEGGRDEMEFEAPRAGPTGPYWMHYRVFIDRSRGTADLAVTTRPSNRAVVQGDAVERTEPLVQNVASVGFAYASGRGSGGWADHWASPTQAPALIEIQLTFADGDRRVWPDFYVQPRITVSPACRFDLAARRCL